MAQYVRVAGAMPASRSRFAAVRPRVPGRAARRGIQRDVREFDGPSGRRGGRPRSRTDRPALHADGGALRRQSADRRRAYAATRRGSRRRGGSARRVRSTADVDDVATIVRDLSPLGADVVCDSSGASHTLEVGLRLARPDGLVVKVGWSPEVIAVDVNPLVHRQRPPAGIVQPQLRRCGSA